MREGQSPAEFEPPVIVLVEPQLGGNIGAAARAMANFGLRELRLVAPRDGWPNPEARAMASGADHILHGTRIFDSVPEAIDDRQLVLATTARPRGLPRPELDPRKASRRLRAAGRSRSAVLFGGERAGLGNDDLIAAEAIIRIPTDPGFPSLNLGQSVLLVAYEWWLASGVPLADSGRFETELANRTDISALAGHLEAELESVGYFQPLERKPSTVAQIRNLIYRQRLTDGEVRMLRGVIRALRRDPAR